MASDRAELAAARVAAAARRADQLRARLARLRAGEASTDEDVALARASAKRQRAEAIRAQERLLHTYAAAATVHRASAGGPADLPRAATASEAPGGAVRRAAQERDDGRGADALRAENLILRRALVSIASAGGGGAGWSKDRRQELWEALVDQCAHEPWPGWLCALCRVAPAMLPGVRGVAVSGYDDLGVPRLLAVTDEWTRQVEEVGQIVGEGPAVDAHRTQALVLVTNLDDEQARWPGYVAATAATGVRSLCAFPVQLDAVGLGSLTFYTADQSEVGWPDWSKGFFLAAVAAQALLADLDAVEDGRPLGDLGDEQVAVAAGMLSVQLGVSVDEASARLRALAFSNAQGLAEVARAVVDGSLRIA